MPKSKKELRKLAGEYDVMIGRNIGNRRVECGLSAEQLAVHIGVSHQQLTKYERGANRVSGGKLVLIASALEINPGAFFQECDPKRKYKAIDLQLTRVLMKRSPSQKAVILTVVQSMVGK